MTRWMRVSPWAALVGALLYGALQAYWAMGNAPAWVFGYDLTISGWTIVGLCAGAALVVAGLRATRGWLPLVVAAWAVSALLLSAAALLLLDVVGGILPGLGIPRDIPGLLSRAACLAIALSVGGTALSWQRRTRSACLRCSGIPKLESTPWWGYVAAYAAVTGFLVRIGSQVFMAGEIPYAPGSALLVFEFGFVLGGVLLPTALVHGWGKVWPRWVLPLAGRRVPRWLVVGPGFAIAGGLLAYFGTGVVQLVGETFDGSMTARETAFMWVAIPAYVVWGIGLAVASVAYYRITRPACTGCGR